MNLKKIILSFLFISGGAYLFGQSDDVIRQKVDEEMRQLVSLVAEERERVYNPDTAIRKKVYDQMGILIRLVDWERERSGYTDAAMRRRIDDQMQELIRLVAQERERLGHKDDDIIQFSAEYTFPFIQFLPNSTRLVTGETDRIYEIIRIIKSLPGVKILVAGHAAHTNARDHEMALSLERANIVARILVSMGLNERDISIAAYGPDLPAFDNSTAEGMAANRRVEITIFVNQGD